MKKIFMLIVLAITLSGCRFVTLKTYSFHDTPMNYIANKKYEYMEYMYFSSYPRDEFKKKSSVSIIQLWKGSSSWNWGLSGKDIKEIKILNDKVKIMYKEKEYYADVHSAKDAVMIYDSGLRISEDFIVYLGKARITLTDGEIKIIELPPLKFRKFIDVSKFNPILGGLNIDTQKTIYRGPLEDYKKKK